MDLLDQSLVTPEAIRERIAKLPEDYQKTDARYMLSKVINHDLGFGAGFEF